MFSGNMKIDDTVNIKKLGGGYWKGKVIEITIKYERLLENGENISYDYSSHIFTIKGLISGHAVVRNSGVTFRDGEYWEK